MACGIAAAPQTGVQSEATVMLQLTGVKVA
jgi:hypothetical protein